MMRNDYIRQVTTTATALSQAFDNANTLISVYFDRGYGSGGANEILDSDLADLGLTAAQLASAITLYQQLQALRNGGAVAAADYDATLNVLRRDI
jgi:hypothetical protein